MNRAVKSIIGFATVLSLLGSTGAAMATVLASAGPNRFVPASPSDAGFISHTVGRYVTNTTTAGSANVVADLGVVTGVTSLTVYIGALREQFLAGNLACSVLLNDSNSGGDVAGSTLFWSNTDNYVVKNVPFSGLSSTTRYTVTAFCSIPAQSNDGNPDTNSRIYSSWVQ